MGKSTQAAWGEHRPAWDAPRTGAESPAWRSQHRQLGASTVLHGTPPGRGLRALYGEVNFRVFREISCLSWSKCPPHSKVGDRQTGPAVLEALPGYRRDHGYTHLAVMENCTGGQHPLPGPADGRDAGQDGAFEPTRLGAHPAPGQVARPECASTAPVGVKGLRRCN